jgi:zinc/manganese transport system substrate-binding protein
VRRPAAVLASLLVLGVLTTGACGSGDGSGSSSVVVTTSILGDVVRTIVGPGDVDVTVVMPAGASPHDFQASARQAVAMREADALIVNGLGFEAGLLDAIDAAEDDGVNVYEAADAVEPLPASVDSTHAEEEAEGHEEQGEDPHFFTDPVRMAAAVRGIADHLSDTVEALDTAAFRARVDAYLADLEDLDADSERLLSAVPPARRKLVTNHEVFGYLADRYGFEVVGAVIPNLSTQAEPSAAALEELSAIIEAEGVPAIFADTSSPSALAEKLAERADIEVEVVELYSESLGPKGSPGDTYLTMTRTNAERIAAALA